MFNYLNPRIMSLELPEAKYSIEDSIVEKSYFKNPVSIIFFKFKFNRERVYNKRAICCR